MGIVVLAVVCFLIWLLRPHEVDRSLKTPVKAALQEPMVKLSKPAPPVDKTSYEYKKAIHEQIDEFLGCTTTVWEKLPDNKYRPRPDLQWFDSNWGDTLKPSVPEQMIIDELQKYDIKWEREISFPGLRLVTGGWGRFDFFLVDHNTVIEYDSFYHDRPDRKEVDKIKTKFCVDNGINLVRYNKQHYHNLHQHVADLMTELCVSLCDTLC
jgi:hypothetical protein